MDERNQFNGNGENGINEVTNNQQFQVNNEVRYTNPYTTNREAGY